MVSPDDSSSSRASESGSHSTSAASEATLWGQPSYLWFLASIGSATLASQVQGAAVAYHLYALTRDPLSLGLIGLAEALPFIASSLPAGHLADVYDRRRLGFSALLVLMLSAMGLIVTSWAEGHLAGRAERACIYSILAATGVCRAFLLPARNALTGMIVPRQLLPAAVKLRAGLWQVMAVTGPAVGGAIYAGFGAALAYAVAAGLLGVALFAWGRVRIHSAGRATNVPSGPMLSSLAEGFRFLRREAVILPAIALDLFAVLFGGAVALLPIFAEDILHVGPRGFGLLRAAPGAGALVTSLVLVAAPSFQRAGRAMLVSVALFGLCTIGFALSRWFAASLVLLAASGAADMVSVVVRGTLIQVRVPGPMQGRLTAINQIFIGSSNEIGAFESGLAARLLGTVPSVVAGGAMTLVVVTVAAWRGRELRRLGPLL